MQSWSPLLLLLFSFGTQAAERIISLSPGSTELLYAAGLGDKLIAASDYSDYPPAARELERVSSYNSINIERIIALDPDLIVAWKSGGQGKSLNRLKELGFTLYYSDASTLDEIAVRIEELSEFAVDKKTGQTNAASFRRQLAQLKQKYHTNRSVPYFYQLGQKPMYTVTEGHWPSEIFSICGGTNIFHNSPVAYPQINTEQVIVRQPEVIFTSVAKTSVQAMWQPWKAMIPAVKKGYIWSLNPDWLNRPTPRSLKAIEEVCQHFLQTSDSTP
ncbi:vitamin B12 ABC transporter substrate-binding protein BtuF [Vibrio albus]|uniref:Vitamin B12-binding protein n=1 Tax=Vibrio albus TaxID=2200953 RepID=A0A2U3BF01_9VIBR|nr:vitamin B12 ABC transporter substrate-binding protein BtuF [Vibrio albus]PWI35343.1 vitamin B12 ABC transporter substrate-binding protein BtuF [Vibrio albus]